ncbi:MAG: hypothetical protein DI637_11965 [Citromicrobium sp.]|nr:MAG: hypothetical protein DI637_11965 [Citromicrobium sp.]
MKLNGKFLALAAIPATLVAMPVLAQASLGMLRTLDNGAWELRFRDGSPTQKICVRSGRELIQIRHKRAGCNRFVVEDGKNQVTVQYTCKGDGYGRTNIRKETGSLVQIDSQGIEGGRPFQFSAEARRTGGC